MIKRKQVVTAERLETMRARLRDRGCAVTEVVSPAMEAGSRQTGKAGRQKGIERRARFVSIFRSTKGSDDGGRCMTCSMCSGKPILIAVVGIVIARCPRCHGTGIESVAISGHRGTCG